MVIGPGEIPLIDPDCKARIPFKVGPALPTFYIVISFKRDLRPLSGALRDLFAS